MQSTLKLLCALMNAYVLLPRSGCVYKTYNSHNKGIGERFQ